MVDEYYEVNKKRWNELVGIHVHANAYKLNEVLAGGSSLHSLEVDAIGDVAGKSLLHLQCHFGLDTLSWATRGARVTGVDFSETAIEFARRITAKMGLTAEFVCGNIYDLPALLDEAFDIVYTSYGVLNWLHDLDGWAKIVARYLKPGGTFFIVEFHPFMWVYDDAHPSELRVKYSYWRRETPEYSEGDGSYADPNATVENRGAYEWPYPLSDVVNALIGAGLVIQDLHEYPYSVDNTQMLFMDRGENGYSRLPRDRLPLMFSIKATKHA